MGFTPIGLSIVAAMIGAVVAWERHGKPVADPTSASWTRIGLAVWLAIAAAIDSNNLHHFAALWLMPIGAYKVAQAIAEPLLRRWGWRIGRAPD